MHAIGRAGRIDHQSAVQPVVVEGRSALLLRRGDENEAIGADFLNLEIGQRIGAVEVRDEGDIGVPALDRLAAARDRGDDKRVILEPVFDQPRRKDRGGERIGRVNAQRFPEVAGRAQHRAAGVEDVFAQTRRARQEFLAGRGEGDGTGIPGKTEARRAIPQACACGGYKRIASCSAPSPRG